VSEWKEALVTARFKQHRNAGKVVMVHGSNSMALASDAVAGEKNRGGDTK
jgi:hypothetical protein